MSRERRSRAAMLADWVRTTLTDRNSAIDELRRTQRTLANQLAKDVTRILASYELDPGELDSEHVNYLGMIYSSLYLHGVGDSNDAMVALRALLFAAADRLGTHPRFLATPYLLSNPKRNGRKAQFTHDVDELRFIEQNAAGVAWYRKAAMSVLEAAGCSLESEAAAGHLRSAAEHLGHVKGVNESLLALSGDSFAMFSMYFGPVQLPPVDQEDQDAGQAPILTLRGVNAGDQPWPSIIDDAFGIEGVKRNDFSFRDQRTRLFLVRDDQQAYEDASARLGAGLRVKEFCELEDTAPPDAVRQALEKTGVPKSVLEGLVALADAHYGVSVAHYALVDRFVNNLPQRAGIGSSGHSTAWLRTLTDQRRSPPGVEMIRRALANS